MVNETRLSLIQYHCSCWTTRNVNIFIYFTECLYNWDTQVSHLIQSILLGNSLWWNLVCLGLWLGILSRRNLGSFATRVGTSCCYRMTLRILSLRLGSCFSLVFRSQSLHKGGLLRKSKFLLFCSISIHESKVQLPVGGRECELWILSRGWQLGIISFCP